MKYNHDYKLHLSIGFYSGASQSDTVNPSKEMSSEEWEEMTEAEQQQWLEDYLADWANNYIETCVLE